MAGTPRSHTIHVVSIVFALLILGCGDDNPLAPFQPEVTNATDNFQLQATNVRRVSTTLTYQWVNNGAAATVNHSTTLTRGTARIIIRAPSGSTVYDHALEPSLNEQTAVGQAGTWEIEVILVDYSGTLNFRVQRV